MFILGCIISLLFSVLSMASKKIKQFIISKFSSNTVVPVRTSDTERLNASGDNSKERKVDGGVLLKVMLALYYFYYSLVHILTMLLIMTMNGYVILSMVLGLTIGYVIFEQNI